MRAALYLRVSGPEQAKGWSLDGQYADGRRYCDRHEYRVVRVYKDVASGRQPSRQGVQMLLKHAAEGRFDVVVVWRQDRFGRSVRHYQAMKDVLTMAGVRLESSMVGPREDSAEARFHENIQCAADEYEADKITERFALGKRTMAWEGLVPTHPPPGYKRDHESKAVFPGPTAWIYRYAVLLASEGLTTRQISGITGLSRHEVMHAIDRDAYIGHLVYKDIRVNDALPAILAVEDVMRARRLQIQNRVVPWNSPRRFTQALLTPATAAYSDNGPGTPATSPLPATPPRPAPTRQ